MTTHNCDGSGAGLPLTLACKASHHHSPNLPIRSSAQVSGSRTEHSRAAGSHREQNELPFALPTGNQQRLPQRPAARRRWSGGRGVTGRVALAGNQRSRPANGPVGTEASARRRREIAELPPYGARRLPVDDVRTRSACRMLSNAT